MTHGFRGGVLPPRTLSCYLCTPIPTCSFRSMPKISSYHIDEMLSDPTPSPISTAHPGVGSYAVFWNVFKRLAAGASQEEKTALFSGTATRIYKLEI